MKTYIAGKIAGDPDYRDKFSKAEVMLNEKGFDVILNSTFLPNGMTNGEYMRICFAMIDCADVVAFLPDYTQSKGALLEWQYCQYVEKQTFYLEE